MKLLTILLLSLAIFTQPLVAKEFNDADIMEVKHPDWFVHDEFFDLEGTLESAKSSDKQGLIVFFTTQGCSYCNLFIRKSLGNPDISKRVQDNFAMIGLEIFDDTEMTSPSGETSSVRAFAEKHGVNFAPTLLFFDEAGKRVHKAMGYQTPLRFTVALDFLTGKFYRNSSFHDYVKKLISKTRNTQASASLREDSLFSKPPYLLDRSRFAASQPLLVIFEKADCPECDQFHDKVLALNEVRNKLEQFEVVRLNAEDTKTRIIKPDGSRTNPADWFAETGMSQLPALALFNEKGKHAVQTDAIVLRQRMLNLISYMQKRSYDKGWTYQRHARNESLERMQKASEASENK